MQTHFTIPFTYFKQFNNIWTFNGIQNAILSCRPSCVQLFDHFFFSPSNLALFPFYTPLKVVKLELYQHVYDYSQGMWINICNKKRFKSNFSRISLIKSLISSKEVNICTTSDENGFFLVQLQTITLISMLYLCIIQINLSFHFIWPKFWNNFIFDVHK